MGTSNRLEAASAAAHLVKERAADLNQAIKRAAELDVNTELTFKVEEKACSDEDRSFLWTRVKVKSSIDL